MATADFRKDVSGPVRPRSVYTAHSYNQVSYVILLSSYSPGQTELNILLSILENLFPFLYNHFSTQTIGWAF